MKITLLLSVSKQHADRSFQIESISVFCDFSASLNERLMRGSEETGNACSGDRLLDLRNESSQRKYSAEGLNMLCKTIQHKEHEHIN